MWFTHLPPLQQTAADPDGERPTVGKAHVASVPGLLRGTLAPDGPPYPFSDLVTHPDAARRAPVHTDTDHVIPWCGPAPCCSRGLEGLWVWSRGDIALLALPSAGFWAPFHMRFFFFFSK